MMHLNDAINKCRLGLSRAGVIGLMWTPPNIDTSRQLDDLAVTEGIWTDLC